MYVLMIPSNGGPLRVGAAKEHQRFPQRQLEARSSTWLSIMDRPHPESMLVHRAPSGLLRCVDTHLPPLGARAACTQYVRILRGAGHQVAPLTSSRNSVSPSHMSTERSRPQLGQASEWVKGSLLRPLCHRHRACNGTEGQKRGGGGD